MIIDTADLLEEARKIPIMEVRHSAAIKALGQDNQELSDALCLTENHIVELEVERVVSKATEHAAFDCMNETNRTLKASVQELTCELQTSRQANLNLAASQDDLRWLAVELACLCRNQCSIRIITCCNAERDIISKLWNGKRSCRL